MVKLLFLAFVRLLISIQLGRQLSPKTREQGPGVE
jgi:hypothetical protein